MAFNAEQLTTTSPPSRVFVTGAGIVTSLGLGWEVNAIGFREGRAALRDISLFDTSRQRTSRGGEVELPTIIDQRQLTDRQFRRLDRASKLLLLAGYEAWDQARWGEHERQLAPPVVIGTSAGGMSLGEAYYQQAASSTRRHGQATRVALYQPQSQVLTLSHSLGINGPISIVSNACASGADAIGQAYRLIRSGRAECVITGGYDALCQLVFAGFDSLQALTPGLPRPFDAGRDGLALGEGAAVLMLESEAHAAARDASLLGEIGAYGCATDVHHLTQPHPQGLAALASMTAACREANVSPTDVDYINAHGTGTRHNDAAESIALNRLFGSSTPVVSTKAYTGHTLGACGAAEAILSILSMQYGFIPAALGSSPVDEGIDLYLPQACEERPIRFALSNAFAFGGNNCSVLLEKA